MDLIRRMEINNTIINNASLETNRLKRSFGDRILAFFSIYLTAALLSSFVLYEYYIEGKHQNPYILKYFLVLIIITGIVLTSYSIVVYCKFFKQYLRQKIYRDINNEITLIQCDVAFFFGLNPLHNFNVSLMTLDDFLKLLKESCYQKNRHKFISRMMFKEWPSIYFASVAFSLLIILPTIGAFYV